ncbi:MAG TPA: hypothetical protein VLO11_02500, partial [Luteolibacter sp.]|nr:hypothetical protein [Luteolibacter sp.]
MPTPSLSGPPATGRMRGLRPLPSGGDAMAVDFSRPFELLPGIPAPGFPPPGAPVRPFADPPPTSFQASPPPASDLTADFTDDDLREALEPIMEQAVRKA